MSKILVTGSTGFVGKRLVYRLLEQGHEVYALSRFKGMNLDLPSNNSLYTLYGDIKDPANMEPFPIEIEAAYYLVHSMGSLVENLIEEEENIARNFLQALQPTQCKQIIFLSGIIEDEKALSPHLRSRLAVEKILQQSSIPCTILRSSIIIGAGSASFEIIRDLTELLPIMIAPKWVLNYCQPISISDILFYLTACLLNSSCFGNTYDIGGPEAMTFRDILLRYAKFRGLKRYIIDIPVLTPKLSSYWLVLISSVRFSICKYLVESMKYSTRKLNYAIDKVLPHHCLSYEEALKMAFLKISQNEVVSTWMDAWDLKQVSVDLKEFIKVPQEGCFKDIKTIPITLPLEQVQERIWSIGGEQGWYSMNWAWSLRGLIDKLIGGTGMNRGRRHPSRIEVGDSIDFWRVLLANTDKTHLILYAEMKLPGEAWLEFEIDPVKKILTQTATFRPKGLIGRLYWYALIPFHWIIFENMAKTLAQKKLD